MAEFLYELKIPKSRIAVLIGKNGEIKRKIESETSTVLDIDSKEGDVSITGDDALAMYQMRSIITAIGRGFNPDVALLLLKPDYMFELISLNDWSKSKNHLQRVKGRIIGTEGKCRKVIEELTECSISVYGKTIGLIGNPDSLGFAKKAVEMILAGSPHSAVYKFLESKRRRMKQDEMMMLSEKAQQ